PRALLSFPTRRSSDLCLRRRNCPIRLPITPVACSSATSGLRTLRLLNESTPSTSPPAVTGKRNAPRKPLSRDSCRRRTLGSRERSEEHTSELQSLTNL